MPAPWGVVDSGFNIKTYEEILEDLENAYKTIYGSDIAVGQEFRGSSLAAQECEILAASLYESWQALQDTWANSFPDMATGNSLDHAVSLVGVARQAATYSVATITLTNTDTADQVFLAGSLVSQSSTGQQWVTLADVTVPALSTSDVTCRPDIQGAVAAVIGSIDTLVTVVTGITSVTNSAVATIGFDRETDEELRLAKQEKILLSQGGLLPAVIEAVSSLDGITYVAGEENDTHVTVDGIAPNSIKITIGGSGYDSQEVALTIAEKKGTGIGTNGAVTESVTTSWGQTIDIKYDTVTEIPVYFDVTVTTDSNYPVDGDDLIKSQLVLYGETLNNGDTLYHWRAIASLYSIPGITSVTLLLDTSPAPVDNNDLTAAVDERLLIDLANIGVTS